MAFDEKTKVYISTYIEGHLPKDEDIEKKFNYIEIEEIRNRIIVEFKNTRYIYKFFEGMEAKDDLLLAQVRLQIIMYSNVYEAIVHYLLFDVYKTNQYVIELMKSKVTKEICIPKKNLEKIKKELAHCDKEIKTYYIDEVKRDITKIRFDEKTKTAKEIGLIDEELMNELNSFYEIRNAIHLHAELKKDISYAIGMSKHAYWRIKKFNMQVKSKLISDELFSE